LLGKTDQLNVDVIYYRRLESLGLLVHPVKSKSSGSLEILLGNPSGLIAREQLGCAFRSISNSP
jgi:hypothetical protein